MKNILIALLLGSCAIANAQNLSGIVSDENGPLPGVSIYIPELQKGTVTNMDGSYELRNLPQANIQIVYSFLGYAKQTKTLKLQDSTVLNILLEANAHQMDEVVVSSLFNRLQSENVMKVDYVSVENLQQQGGTSLSESIVSIPGVSQVSTGSSIGKPVIRGLTGNRVVVYTQGIRLENQQFGDEHGLGLSDSGIESVEVIKGPASLLYGSDALGGVLYFNPEKFAYADVKQSDFSQRFYSNTLGSNTSFGYKQSTDNWKYLIRGNYATHSDYKVPKDNRVVNSRFNETDIKAAIGYSTSDFSSVLRYNFGQLDLGIPDEVGGTSSSKKTLYPSQLVQSHLLSLQNSLFFGNSKIESTLGYTINDRKEFEDSAEAALFMKLRTLSYDVKYHLPKFDNFSAIAGIQGMYQDNENLGEERLIPDATTTDFGIFATGNYAWRNQMLQAGFRYDHRNIDSQLFGNSADEGYFEALNKSFNSINASLGYKVSINEPTTLRLNLASGFRAPNLSELLSNGVHEGTNRYEIGDSTLKTEQNVQADLNLDYKMSHFDFFVNGFYNHINNYIYTQPNGNMIADDYVFVYTQSDAILFGGEVGLHYHPHPYDWLHFESSFEMVRGKKQNGGFLPLMPANNWHNSVRAEFSDVKWISKSYARVDVISTLKQTEISTFEVETDGYTLLNGSVGGKIAMGKIVIDLSLSAQNILNKTYYSHLSRLKVDGIQNIGRNIIIGAKFNLI